MCILHRVVRSYFKDPKTSNVIKGEHGCGMWGKFDKASLKESGVICSF